jgi:DNA-3-methyladenine glycosylase I
MTNQQLVRCGWCEGDSEYEHYHDTLWGMPVKDPQDLFAKLCLDGQQAGLSWLTILRKWDAYHTLFYNFNPDALVRMPDYEREALYTNPAIIRSQAKIDAIFTNARAYLKLRDRGQNFSEFLWKFVDFEPTINAYQALSEVPTETTASRQMAKALKKEGFKFVGPTICYAFMEAVGMVNDHLIDCHRYEPCKTAMETFRLSTKRK